MTDRGFASPKFLYFDLGNVLMFFDHHRACRQLAQRSGADEQHVWAVLFASGLELEYEAGRVTSRQLHEVFLRETKTQLGFDEFAVAFSDIFEVNIPMKIVLAQLAFCGHRLGLLSNTNELHWQWLTSSRYALFPSVFEQLVLSYEIGSIKPETAIFQAAIQRAGVPPESIFYMDDMAGHVVGAQAEGIDAVQFTDTPTLVAQLHDRGIEFNY